MSGHNHHTFVMWLGGRAQNCIKISRGYSWQPLILHMKVNISYDTFSASTILYLLSQCNTVVLLLYDDNIQVPGVSCPSPGADCLAIWCPLHHCTDCSAGWWLMMPDVTVETSQLSVINYLVFILPCCRSLWSAIKETGTCMVLLVMYSYSVSGCDINHCIGLFVLNKIYMYHKETQKYLF